MRFVSMLIIAAALAACAAAPAKRLPSDAVDADKVAAVNRWAEEKHATVIWLRYPTQSPAHSAE